MTSTDQPDPTGGAGPEELNLPVAIPASPTDEDDDIIDAEIVEDPVPPSSPAAPTPPAAPTSPDPAVAPVPPNPAVAPTPPAAPSLPAAAWGAPPVPSVPVDPITDYTEDGVPTFSYLQEKVEKRYATALGSHELADATIPEVQQAAKRQQELAKSAEERLAEIRRSLHPDS